MTKKRKKVAKKKAAKKKASPTPPRGWKLPKLKDEGEMGWTLKKPIPCWGGKRLAIRLERDHDEAEPSPEQVATLARLLTRKRDLRPAFAKGAHRFFKEVIVANLGMDWVEEQVYPPVRKRADIWEHFKHWSVSIDCYDPGQIVFESICAWTGHGFGAVFVDGVLTRMGDSGDDYPFEL